MARERAIDPDEILTARKDGRTSYLLQRAAAEYLDLRGARDEDGGDEFIEMARAALWTATARYEAEPE